MVRFEKFFGNKAIWVVAVAILLAIFYLQTLKNQEKPPGFSCIPLTIYLFFDNFDSNGVDKWAPSSGNWVVSNRVYSQTLPQGEAITLTKMVLDNFTASIKVRILSAEGKKAGLILRAQASNSARNYKFVVAEKSAEFIKDDLVLKRWSIDYLEPTARTTLRVIAEGDYFEIFIDDKKVGEVFDSTYSVGNFGLFTQDASAEFDETRVAENSQGCGSTEWTGV